jgi:hypothetical protein
MLKFLQPNWISYYKHMPLREIPMRGLERLGEPGSDGNMLECNFSWKIPIPIFGWCRDSNSSPSVIPP